MIQPHPLHVAIAAHRAAWDAFQVAPDGEAVHANDEMRDALDTLVTAACAFPILSPPPSPDLIAPLLAHLRWWLAEEAEFADGYQPAYGILSGRAADLAAVLKRDASRDATRDGVTADPIHGVLATWKVADREVMRVLVETADDDGPKAETRFKAEDDRRDAAEKALRATTPTTLPGLAALIRHYEAIASDPASDGFVHLVKAIELLLETGESKSRFSVLQSRKAQLLQKIRRVIPEGIPGQPEVEAAWHALPAETRDRIGVIAVDMAMQSFIAGHAHSPRNRAVPGRSAAAHAIRRAADDACSTRLTELHQVVEDAIPDLFGPDGENPRWAVRMGARR